MTWNYRVVQVGRPDAPYYDIREVYYNERDQPFAHGSACLGSEEGMTGIEQVLEMVQKALTQPILFKADFVDRDAHEVGV